MGANMQVERVSVHLSSEHIVQLYANITLDDCLMVHGMKVLRQRCRLARCYAKQEVGRKGGKFELPFLRTEEGSPHDR
jgi:hypothetical protein